MANNKIHILRRSSEFEHLRLKGRKVSTSHWLVFVFSKNDKNFNRWGWTVSSRVGSAVIRNKLKRWSRVCSKKTEPSLVESFPCDINVVFKAQNPDFYKKLSFDEFQKTFDRTWSKLSKSRDLDPRLSSRSL